MRVDLLGRDADVDAEGADAFDAAVVFRFSPRFSTTFFLFDLPDIRKSEMRETDEVRQ